MNNNKDKAKLTKQLGYVYAVISIIGGFVLTAMTQGYFWLIVGFVGALFIGTVYDTLGTILEEVINIRNSNICYNNKQDPNIAPIKTNPTQNDTQ